MQSRLLHCTYTILAALLILFGSTPLRAQVPSTAAAYPFTPASETFTYLTGGTAVPSIYFDDATQTGIPIGFPFEFAGGTYTTLSASSNGWLSFANSGSTTFTNASGTMSTIAPCVMPLFDDLSGSGGASASYLTTGTAPSRVFTFEWKNWQYPLGGTNNISFQVKLYEGGVIKFYYKQEPPSFGSASASVGIAKSATDYKMLDGVTASPTPSTTTFHASISARPASDQVYIWGQLPCTGMPVTSVAGPSEVCPDRNFTLSLSGLSLYSGFTFTWQKSANGKAWTNFTGTINPLNGDLTDNIKTPAYYRCIVKCNNSNLTYTTPAHFVDIAPFYYCYCDNQGVFTSTNNKVNIGNLKITAVPNGDVRLENPTISGNVTGNGNANKTYSDFKRALPPIKMYRDSSFRMEVHQFNSQNPLAYAQVIAYLDYDRNGIFDDYERIFLENSFDQSVPGVIVDTFKVSDTAHIGLTGLRVIIKEGSTIADSCGNYANGETEDYLVDIRYQPCKGPVNAGLALASDTSSCPDYKYWIIDSTYERQMSEVSKRWQFSADSIVWHNIPNSSNQDSLVRIFNNNQPFYYRMQMKCEATGDSTYSNPVRVNNKAGYKCYCFSQAIGNENDMGLDSSDAGGLQVAGFNLNQGGSHLRNPGAWYARKDFTDLQPIELYVDTSYQFDIYHTMPGGYHGDAKVTLFIDYNNNHQYDIPDERVYTGFTTVGIFQLTPNIYIPNNAIVNVPTGMRLIINNNLAPNAPSDSACGTYISGETEDYMITFRRKFPVSVINSSLIKGMQVYPNPSNGKFNVEFTSEAGVQDVKVQVTNVTGQKVFEQQYEQFKGKFSQQIDLNGAAPGVYFVELNADGQKQVQRLIIR